jgi:hypothetical protein
LQGNRKNRVEQTRQAARVEVAVQTPIDIESGNIVASRAN